MACGTWKGVGIVKGMTRRPCLLLVASIVLGTWPAMAHAQGVPFVEPRAQFFDSNGDPLNGGLLYTYACGGTTNQNTYTTEALSVANANPVVADSAGRMTVFLDKLCYRFDLKTSAGVSIWSIDNVQPPMAWNGTTVTAKWQALTPTVLTLASNAVVPTRNVHALDTAGGAGTLNSITATNVASGFLLTITGNNPGANPVTVASGAGNISLANGTSFVMNTATSWIELVYYGTTWYEVSRSIQSTFNTDDTATVTITNIISMNHSSSNIPAAGFGTGLLFTGESSTTDLRQMGRIQSRWTTATDATRTAALDFQTVDTAGALTTMMSLSGAGLLTVSGYGTHTFSAAGAAGNILALTNTTSGATASAQVQAIGGTTTGTVVAYSQGYTTGTYDVQAAVGLIGSGVGGVSIAATNASGDIRFYAGGTTEVGRIDGPQWFINDTANVNNLSGLTINQLAADDEVLTMKSSDVATGVTNESETDTYFFMRKASALEGGVLMESLREAGTGVGESHVIITGTNETAKNAAAQGQFQITGYKISGVSAGALDANTNVFVVRDGTTTRFILDSDGDSHEDVGTSWTNFDAHDDALVLNSLAVEVARPDDPHREAIKARFEGDMKTLLTRRQMEQLGLVTFSPDGHHFVNMSKLTMLTVGATRQATDMLRVLQRRFDALELLNVKLAADLETLKRREGQVARVAQ